ncbi:putative serine/threonine-protein kinase [Hibiscus syriacus]|uniref:Serine/threonine-protein kinase n=1 Tax=Hibiscus syriacus TaxID=106335 RepID=A0A6A2ZAR6_HIBSY|nr:putative serine/threonine-protein kinase [Hibiscus syriacus]
MMEPPLEFYEVLEEETEIEEHRPLVNDISRPLLIEAEWPGIEEKETEHSKTPFIARVFNGTSDHSATTFPELDINGETGGSDHVSIQCLAEPRVVRRIRKLGDFSRCNGAFRDAHSRCASFKISLGYDDPLSFITDSLEILAGAMVPSVMLILGGMLSEGPNESRLGLRTTIGIIVARLLVLPLLGIGIVTLASKLNLLVASDAMYRFVLLLQYTTPSAILLGAIASLRSYAAKRADNLFLRILLVEDLDAWNVFPWGSYLWKATWKKSSAFEDRRSLRGHGSKYTLEANYQLQRLSLPLIGGKLVARHRESSPDREDYTSPHREPSPIPSHHRASSPPSPHDRRPKKMPRHLSPRSPPPRDELGELRDEVSALRDEVGTLSDDNGAWRDEVAALREIVSSLHNEVHTLRNERPDKVDALRWVFLTRRGSRIRHRTRAITSPFTPIVPRMRKKKPDSPVIVQEAPSIVQEAPPIVQEALLIIQQAPPTVQEPDSHGILCRHIDKPSLVPGMMDRSWLSYQLPANTIPQQERRKLPDTIMDNTLWAKTAIDFYLQERSQGYYDDICKIDDNMHLFLERSWWGVLLGVEENSYFEWGDQRDASYALGNGKAIIYPTWWEVDKLPSLKTIVYDNMLNYIPLSDLKDIIYRGWSAHLAKNLDVIDYWTNSGNKKSNKLKVTMMRDETEPQQTARARRDCGPLVCMCLEHMTTGDVAYMYPRAESVHKQPFVIENLMAITFLQVNSEVSCVKLMYLDVSSLLLGAFGCIVWG